MCNDAGAPSGSGQCCPTCGATLSREAAGGTASAPSSGRWKAAAKAGLTVGAAAVTVAAAAVAAAPIVLSAVGFGSAGVVAGSSAAVIQSTMGGVIAKGSLFALCQSYGAVGLTTAANFVVGLSGGGIGAAGATAVLRKPKGRAEKPSGDAAKQPEGKPREEPDGAPKRQSEGKPREEAAEESEFGTEKQGKPEVVLCLCPSCGQKIYRYKPGKKGGQ